MKYFAYANLMDIEYFRRVAPSAKVIGIGCIKDYAMAFGVTHDGAHSGARLEPKPGAEVWGVEFELSDSDMAALDAASGVAHNHWAHKAVQVHGPDGSVRATTTYDIPNPSGVAGPPAHYLDPALKGARANNLPADYVARLEKLLTA